MSFLNAISGMLERPSVRKYYGRIPENRILDAPIAVHNFEPNKHYFRLVLVDLFLKNRGELWRNFVPMALVASEFKYAGETRSLPFIVSTAEVAARIKTPESADAIELSNTLVAGPIPYLGGNVGLFVGLFRTVANDYSEQLFGFLESLCKSFDLSCLGSYLKVGEAVRDSLHRVLGWRDVEYCFGRRDEFFSEAASVNPFRSGYLVFVNAPIDAYSQDSFAVSNGRLYECLPDGRQLPFAREDYCLLAIEQLTTRSDLAYFPFNRIWTEMQAMIWKGKIVEARLRLEPLTDAIFQSPDLSPDDQSYLMLHYRTILEAEVDKVLQITQAAGVAPTRGGQRTRRDGHGRELGMAAMLQKAAQVAEAGARDSISALAFHYLAKKSPLLGAAVAPGQPASVDQKDLDCQLAALRQAPITVPDPARLRMAITLDLAATFSA